MSTGRPEVELRAFLQHLDRRLAGQIIAPGTDVVRTAAAVLQVLAQRIDAGAPPREAGSWLPALVGIAPDLEDDGAYADGGAGSFGFDGFLARVSARSGATEDAAHRITQAVFAELRRQLPAPAVRSVASRLPADLLVLWRDPETGQSSEGAIVRQSRRPAASVPFAASAAADPFLKGMLSHAPWPDHVNVSSAFVAATCLMMLALPAERAGQMRRALPAPLGDLLGSCSLEREEEATVFGRDEYLETLAAELEVATRDAEQIAAVALLTARQHLPAEEADAVAKQLPRWLRTLWTGSPSSASQASGSDIG